MLEAYIQTMLVLTGSFMYVYIFIFILYLTYLKINYITIGTWAIKDYRAVFMQPN